MKLGSLFDGIAGFPLAAQRNGIETVWASEIEPVPIAISSKHFPNMKHLGDIKGINGAEIEPVDIISFGSPCQDLSVAGKREGLKGERSGLFMEAVRIIREMREATNGEYPTFAIWENVPGALSSNKGGDFRAVLEEIAEAEIPMPYSGRWAEAGMVRRNGREIAWRCLDAQYWGIPQRRKRIFLIADFRGQRAGEILFEQPCLPWDSSESRKAREEIAASVGDGFEGTSRGMKQQHFVANPVLNDQGDSSIGIMDNLSPTLRAETHGNLPCIVHRKIAGTLRANAGAPKHEADWEQLICCPQTIPINDKATRCKGGGDTRKNDGAGNGLGVGKPGDPCPTITAGDRHAVCQPIAFNCRQDPVSGNIPGALDTDRATQCICHPVLYPKPANTLLAKGNFSFRADVDNMVVSAVDVRNLCENEELSGTLQAKNNGGYSLNYQNPVRIGYRVRRLTPLEAERLQGFSDYWTARMANGESISDTQRYRAIGNSIAIPPVEWIFGQIVKVCSNLSP